MRLVVAMLCLAFVVLCVSAANAQSPEALKALGLEYKLQKIKKPRPNRVHVLRIDLAKRKVRPSVIVGPDPDGDGPAETALTSPLKLAKGQDVVAFVNTNPWDSFPDKDGKRNRRWFEGQPVDISGLAVAGGKTRSAAKPNAAAVSIGASGKAWLGEGSERAVEGMNGFQRIVKDGKLITQPSEARHPRTGIGVDKTGKILWLVVVDGRQRGFSEGMSVHELGKIMLDLGCWNANNMDGGGSSVMGLMDSKGKVRVINSPSDRRRGKVSVRPLPMVLTIKRLSSE